MTAPNATDPIMDSIGRAVTEGRAGNVATARAALLTIWGAVGVGGDPFHRCTLAHYLADLYDDPAQALVWDVRAVDAAEALTDQRVQEHEAVLRIAGFFPSLHLNLADNFRRLGSFDAAREQIDAAREHSSALADDPYGRLIREVTSEVADAIARLDPTPRASAPGSVS